MVLTVLAVDMVLTVNTVSMVIKVFPMKTTVYLDKESSEAMKELPRKVSASALLRHILKALVSTDENWDRYITTSEEGQTVRAFIRTNLKKRL